VLRAAPISAIPEHSSEDLTADHLTQVLGRTDDGFTDLRHIPAHLRQCGEFRLFATYSPSDLDRHAYANHKDVVHMIHRLVTTGLIRKSQGYWRLRSRSPPGPPQIPGIETVSGTTYRGVGREGRHLACLSIRRERARLTVALDVGALQQGDESYLLLHVSALKPRKASFLDDLNEHQANNGAEIRLDPADPYRFRRFGFLRD
jgi:hypothetical protein